MGSLNKVQIIGNLGRDAEVRYTPGGAAVAKFSVATTETWTDKSGQRQEHTEWHNCDLWGKRAESLGEYLVKGKQVYIEGRLRTEEWTDKDGQKRRTTKINVTDVVLLGGRNDGSGRRSAGTTDYAGGDSAYGGAGSADPGAVEPLTDDDIPF